MSLEVRGCVDSALILSAVLERREQPEESQLFPVVLREDYVTALSDSALEERPVSPTVGGPTGATGNAVRAICAANVQLTNINQRYSLLGADMRGAPLTGILYSHRAEGQILLETASKSTILMGEVSDKVSYTDNLVPIPRASAVDSELYSEQTSEVEMFAMPLLEGMSRAKIDLSALQM